MNIQTGVRGLLVSLVAVGLTACGEKVDCNSSAVKKDVLKIIQSHLDRDPSYNQIKPAMAGEPELENIKTIDTDKDRKQAQCSGSYSITYNEKPRSVDVAYDLAYLEDKKETEVSVGVKDIQFWFFKLKLNEPPLKNGEEKAYDGNGRLTKILRWKNNQQDGTQEFYNPENGALVGKFSMDSGKKDGSEKHWTPNGQKLIAEINWADGKKEGREKRWAPDGQQLMADLKWVDGKKNGTEKRIREKDGKLMTDVVWKDDKATGFISSDEIGRYTTTQYKDGLKNGPQKTYDIYRGEEYVSLVENFKDDKLDGLFQQFGSDGYVILERLYSEGNVVQRNATEAEKPQAASVGKTETRCDKQASKAAVEQCYKQLVTETKEALDEYYKDIMKSSNIPANAKATIDQEYRNFMKNISSYCPDSSCVEAAIRQQIKDMYNQTRKYTIPQ